MANTLKLRGGTTAEVAAATLAEREIMVDTTKDVIVVGPTKKEMAVANGGTYTGNYTFSGDVTINGAATFGSSFNANSLRIQNVATPTGNSDATNKSYVDGQITSVQNTTLPGNVFSADGSVTITDNNPGVGDIDLAITPASVTTAKLADGSVTTAKIVDNSVTGAKFANNSITTAKLQDQAVTSAKLAVSAVTSNRIDAGAVGTTKLADASITALKIASNAVTTDKIQNGAVTAAKIDAGLLASHAAEAAAAAASATAAAGSATSAATSAAAAAAAFDNFDDTYLGQKASDPTTDNDGDALTAGDLYFNTTDDVMKVYIGSSWVIAYVPGDAANITNATNGNLTSTNVQDSLQELQGDIDTNAGTISALQTTVGAQGNQVGINQLGVSTNATDIATNATNIATNATAIGARMPLAGGTFTGDVHLDNQEELRFEEATANGNNYVGFKSPAAITSNVVWTLPATDGLAGQALVTDASGTLSWAAAGGASGAGTNLWALEHDNTISGSYTIGAGKNVVSAGPLTINSGVTVTVPAGSNWVIV